MDGLGSEVRNQIGGRVCGHGPGEREQGGLGM